MGLMAIMRRIGRSMVMTRQMKEIIGRDFSTQILKSPQSLVSLDLPEIWTPVADDFHDPPLMKCANEQDVTVIDGKLIAEEIRSTIATEVRRMKESIGKVPGLAVILVGQRRDSQTYVRNKIKACEEARIKSLLAELPVDCPEDAVINAVASFNEDPSIHGCLNALQRHHATVSVVHEFTNNPEEITSEADIVVAAAGVPNLVRGNWLKPGAVVIDVGTCPVEDPGNEFGYRLMGDVCYEEAVKVASAITPVPGGVGPMTIAMLLSNTLDSAKRAYDFV
ncbi:bifunctional protein FolD 1, mitochondrial isoform X2 [Jatropha curcas]|uniref:bifunctional protein FolD 1, mitochondrial isoform X2 n=1 Tax=Jatropha curcas TaxID=180498 RepID=UPI0009D6645B|nr:bifunctional protein FolD 1, mitochondrial isoform X2 [Jatropha curcas]